MPKIKLNQPTTIAGQYHEAGDEVEVEESDVFNYVKLTGVAEEVKSSKSSSSKSK